ncbi:MAG TPA: OmpH family outer membrane protein [Verrucomicrobiae bacterium]|nr:OmpH family outer membrane protein [Verrucomicrobiae bacterium]
MKRLLIKWLPLFLLLGMLPGVAHAQFKAATVDLSRVFTNYWKFKEADLSLQSLRTELATGFEDLKKSEDKGKESYTTLLSEANNQVLSSEERDRKKKAAEDKLREITEIRRTMEQYENQARTRLIDQRTRVRENLLTEIYAVVRSKGKAGNYSLILDSAGKTADQTPIVIYSTAEDITDAVLSQLNAGAPTAPKK